MLGTGLMKWVNLGLIVLLAGLILFAAWNSFKDNLREEGRQEVVEQVQADNQNLTNHVTTVNEDINRRVVNETITINRRSQEIEDVIDAQPDEALSNLSRARLERVRDQQRNIPASLA